MMPTALTSLSKFLDCRRDWFHRRKDAVPVHGMPTESLPSEIPAENKTDRCLYGGQRCGAKRAGRTRQGHISRLSGTFPEQDPIEILGSRREVLQFNLPLKSDVSSITGP